MIEASGSPYDQAVGRIFALFEPCHGKDDRLSAGLKSRGCPALLDKILQCDFHEVLGLWGWFNEHTLVRSHKPYDRTTAANLCQAADLRAFKTAGVPMLGEGAALLDVHPLLHIVDVVRDPRAIVSSWRKTPGMNNETAGAGLLLQICRDYAAQLTHSSSRLHRLVYEDLVRRPQETMQHLYAALELPFGIYQTRWIEKTFSVDGCEESPYSDCRKSPAEHLERWRIDLPQQEQSDFSNDADCQRVARAYGWKL